MAQTEPKDLLELLERSAGQYPDAPAAMAAQGSLNYAQLSGAAKKIGLALSAQTPAPVVALYLPMSTAFASAFFGVLYANKAVVPLNMLLGPEELIYILKDAGADLVITLPDFKEKLEAAKLPARIVAIQELLAPEAKAASALSTRPASDSVACLLYTSGTTGKPKGVMLTHGNIASNTFQSVHTMKFVAGDRFLACLPTFHTLAITATMMAPLAAGGSFYCLPKFDPDAVLQATSEQNCTILIMVPSMYRLITRRQEKSKLPMKVRMAFSGGEALPGEVRDSFLKVFGLELLEGFGMTECSPVITFNRPDKFKTGSVGLPLVGVQVKIVDPELKSELKSGEIGEIWTRGPNVMKGYYNKPEETAQVLQPDGWLRTGDMGLIDAEGFLKITGRLREMIKVGGEMVFPVEVEGVLLKHPAVHEAGVVGIRDEKRGESVKAFVALNPGQTVSADDLLAHCRNLLPVYKVPRTIEFKPELPKGPTGKVMRRLLK